MATKLRNWRVLACATLGVLLIAALAVNMPSNAGVKSGPPDSVKGSEQLRGIDAIASLGRVEPSSRIRRLVPNGEYRNGSVASLQVSVGDSVVAGQLLAKLDNHEHLAADVTVMKSRVQAAEAKLNRVLAGIHPNRIEAKRVEIDALGSEMKMLALDLERAKKLIASNAMSSQRFDEVRWRHDNAVLVRKRLKNELAEVEEVREVDIELAKAELAIARAELEKSIVRCRLAELHSPIDGQVLRIHAREGEAVGNKGLLELADLEQMQVVAEVFEADASRVAAGMRAQMKVVSSGLEFGGTVVELGRVVGRQVVLSGDPVSNVDARVVEVRIDVDSDSIAAISGLSNARVEVVILTASVSSDPSPPVDGAVVQ